MADEEQPPPAEGGGEGGEAPPPPAEGGGEAPAPSGEGGGEAAPPPAEGEAAAPAEGGEAAPAPAEGEEGAGEAKKTGSGTEAKKKGSGSSATKTGSKATRSKSKARQKKGALDLASAKIGFVGAGKMTECIIEGLINFGKIASNKIHIAAPTTKNTERLKSLGCLTTKRNIDIFAKWDCDVIFLCFHGSVIKHCYKLGGKMPHPITTNYIPNMKHPVYILSLVSGVNLDQIKACLLNPEHPDKYILELHRIMLNAAVSYGLGICAVDVEPDGSKLSAPIRTLLSSIARLEHVPESQMDAACAIGGNGLAFAYYFINALADGAFKMGLSRNMAIKFAAKTVQCGAQCLLESGRHPSELLDSVSSPSGAAIYGIHVLDKADVKSGIIAAVEAAHKRASELAESDNPSS